MNIDINKFVINDGDTRAISYDIKFTQKPYVVTYQLLLSVSNVGPFAKISGEIKMTLNPVLLADHIEAEIKTKSGGVLSRKNKDALIRKLAEYFNEPVSYPLPVPQE